MDQLAPIIIFTYNRPVHTRTTLEYLEKNELADKSTLFVFCDGAKSNASEKDIEQINAVKKVVRSRQWTKEVHVFEAEKNKGLATNVIEGVTKIVNEYGKAIVLEDDLLISKGFLKYMNNGLNRYEKNERVKQISGFLFPISSKQSYESFFMPITNTIGWGTWKRAWNEIDLKATGYEKLKKDRELRYRFNLDGTYNYTKILFNQIEKNDNSSWAIFYWWSVFTKNGLTLFPDYTLIQHNDFDSSGTHESDYTHYDQNNWQDDYSIKTFPDEIVVNESAYSKLKKYTKDYNRVTMKKIFFKIKLMTSKVLSK